jgi:hypothetical protein
MRVRNRYRAESRIRAAALLLTCILGLTLVTSSRSPVTHKQVTHRPAVLVVTAADGLHLAQRPDLPGNLPAALATGSGGAVATALANSSTAVSSRTADAPQPRGPPGHALA